MKPIQRRAFIRNAVAATTATAATAATAASAAVTAAAPTTVNTAVAPQQPSGGSANPTTAERAIHQLHHTFVAQLNSGQHELLGALFASEPPKQTANSPVYILGHAQHLDTVSIAPDQLHATARFHCLARLEATLDESAPYSLLEMARQQGQGVIQRWESGVLESEYVKVASLWKIANVSFAPTASSETPPAPATEPATR